MSTTLPPVTAILLANITNFESGMKKARTEMQQTSDEGKGHMAGLAGSVGSSLATVGVAVAGAGVALAGFGVMAADKFKDVGLEVGKLERLTGQSAETMSKWRYAAIDSGISSDQLGTAIAKLSKDIMGHTDKVAAYGVATRDAQGHTRDFNDIMLDLADRFQKTTDPMLRNKMAMDLFGKSGTDMEKILNKGSGALREMMDQAQATGQVLGQDGVDAAGKAAKAQRELGMAWDGLQMTIGQYVLPVLTQVAIFLKDTLVGAIAFVKIWINDHRDDLVRLGQKFADVFNFVKSFVVDTVFPALVTAYQAVSGAISTVIDWFSQHEEATKALGVVVGIVLVGALGAYVVATVAAAAATLVAWAPVILVIAALAALGLAIYEAYQHWDWFRNAVDKVWEWIKENAPKVWDAVKNAISAFVDWWTSTAWPWLQKQWEDFQKGWDQVAPKVVDAVHWIQDAFHNLVQWWTDHIGTVDDFKRGIDRLKDAGQWLGDKFTWLKEKVFDPVFGSLQDFAKPILDGISNAFNDLKDKAGTLGDKFTWLKEHVLDPVWGSLQWAQEHIVQPLWDVIQNVINGIDKILSNVPGLKNVLGNGDQGPAPAGGGGGGGGGGGQQGDNAGTTAGNIVRGLLHLADGGIVPATPGGVHAIIGEGGQDEAVIPLDRMREMANSGPTIHVTINVEGSVTSDGELAEKVATALRRREMALT